MILWNQDNSLEVLLHVLCLTSVNLIGGYIYSIKENTNENQLILYSSSSLLMTLPVKRLVNKKLTVQAAMFVYICFTDMFNVSLSHLQVQNSTRSDAKIYPLGSKLGLLLFPSHYACTRLEGIGREKFLVKNKEKNFKYLGLFELIYSEEI